MTRIKLVLAVAAVMVAMLTALPGPAMAADWNDWDEDWGFWTWAPGWWGWHDDWNDGGLSFDQSAESGDVDIDTSVRSSGDYSNQSVAPLQFANTGNLQNAQGLTQVDSEAGDIEFEGSSFEFSPRQDFDSSQTIRQSAASRR